MFALTHYKRKSYFLFFSPLSVIDDIIGSRNLKSNDLEGGGRPFLNLFFSSPPNVVMHFPTHSTDLRLCV